MKWGSPDAPVCALVGFGLDSEIEVASGMALLWRLHHDLDPSSREQLERTTVRIVGVTIVIPPHL